MEHEGGYEMKKECITISKLVASIMLFFALADNPYSYYQILRWIVCLVAGYSAYIDYTKSRVPWVFILGIIAILFNPIAPIHLSRETWSVVDIVVALIFLINIFMELIMNKKSVT